MSLRFKSRGKKSAAHQCWNFDDLLEKIWDCLRLGKLSTKPKTSGQATHPQWWMPSSRATVEDFCMKIHKNLSNNLNILIPSDKNELKYLPVALALIAFRDSGQTLDTRYWLY